MADEEKGGTPSPTRAVVLVPVDFSPSSEAALVLACDLAACMHAEVCILHVVHDPGDAPGYYQVEGREQGLRRLEDVAKDMLNAFADRVRDERPDLGMLKTAQRMLVVGLPVTRILEVVEKLQPRLVVMGSAGRTGMSHLMLGSKAEQVVRLCPAPVTIVKVDSGKTDD